MFGKKLSDNHLQALWASRYTAQRINKPESKALKILCQYGFEYVGDRAFWLTFKDGTHKCPDFVNKSCKMAVEVYGDYWHRNDNPQDIIEKYKQIGWDCLVVWEHEVYESFTTEFFEQWLGIYEHEDLKFEELDGRWLI